MDGKSGIRREYTWGVILIVLVGVIGAFLLSIHQKKPLGTKIFIAISENSEKKLRNLIAQMKDIDDDFPENGLPPPLHMAIDLQRRKLVRILLDAGADPNAPYRGEYPLIRSIVGQDYGNHDRYVAKLIMRDLLNAGADANVTDDKGRRARILAKDLLKEEI